jgi:hypothetical protein
MQRGLYESAGPGGEPPVVVADGEVWLSFGRLPAPCPGPFWLP